MIIFLLVLGVTFSSDPSDETGGIIFFVLVLGLVLTFGLTIGRSSITRYSPPPGKFTFSYSVDVKYPIFPVGSTLYALGSLVWTLLAQLSDEGVEVALGFFIAFVVLDAFEFIRNWFNATYYNGSVFGFTEDGFERHLGTWSKAYRWSDFSSFSTVYEAHYGRYLSWIPFLSVFYAPFDRYTINLYFKAPRGSAYAQIRTRVDNLEQVLSYVRRHVSPKDPNSP